MVHSGEPRAVPEVGGCVLGGRGGGEGKAGKARQALGGGGTALRISR